VVRTQASAAVARPNAFALAAAAATPLLVSAGAWRGERAWGARCAR
jgi:hypothetical protein